MLFVPLCETRYGPVGNVIGMLLRPPFRNGGGPRPAPTAPGVRVRTGVRLAVDVGTVRIGVARSDEGGILATPLTVVRRGKGDLDALAELAARSGPVEVIAGLPTSLSGRESHAAKAARDFAAALANRIAPIPVRLVDERFTTTTAHGALRLGGKDSRARRQVVDAAAAAVLLQAALDTERGTGYPPGELVTEGPARD
jgi:putative Holliday junction resolvase